MRAILEGLDPTLLYILLKPARFALFLLDLFLGLFGWSLLHGSAKEREEARKDGRIEGHVYKVQGRVGRHFVVDCKLESFLLTHDRYVDPLAFARENHVVHMGFDAEHAFFSVAAPGTDMWDMSRIPFMYLFQCGLAERIFA